MSQKLIRGLESLAKPGVSEYLAHYGSRPHPIKSQIILETHRHFPKDVGMLLDPIQGDFIQLLVKATNAKKCLEVGVFTGYSSLCMALGLPADGHIEAFDISKEFTTIAKEHWKLAGVANKISLHLTPGIEGLKHLISHGGEECYDFAFIDADKENGVHYYNLCMQLLRHGGMILIDNTLWGGSVADKESTRAGRREVVKQNETVYTDRRVDMCMLPMIDGIIVAVKK